MNPTSHPDPHRDITAGPLAEGGAHVVVTIESIYTLLLDVRDGVRDVSAAATATAEKATDHEARIRSLERKVWIASGLAAAGVVGLDRLATALGG